VELDTDRGGATGIKIGRYSLKGKAGKKGGQGAAQLTVRYICCAVALRCTSFARRMQFTTPPFSTFLNCLAHPCCLRLPMCTQVYDASLQRDHDAEAEEEEGDDGRASFRDGLRCGLRGAPLCVSDTWALVLGLYGRYFYIHYVEIPAVQCV
jgi:hypothetical protein